VRPGEAYDLAAISAAARALTALASGRGVFVSNDGGRLTVSTREERGVERGFHYRRVTGALRDGTNWRWFYASEEVVKSSKGYGGWTTKTGGRTGTTTAGFLLNDWEENNDARWFHGVDTDEAGFAATGLEPVAVRTGTIVRVWTRPVHATGGTGYEHVFWHPGTIDGSCAPAPS
jgi:hypothetical protein